MTNAELLAKIKAEIERQKTENNNIKCKYNEKYCIGYDDAFNDILSFLDTLQEPKYPKDLQSLINEASETAQRIIDRHSFYTSLPENLRHKYTEDSWLEILDAISKYGKQEQEVDLEKEADRMFFSLGWYEGDHHQPMLDCVSLVQFRGIARHFYELGKNAK